jgi:hypothetical protein
VSRTLKKTFNSKFFIGLLDGSELIKTKIVIKKYVKYLKSGYPAEFENPTQNHNKMAEIKNFPKSMLSTLKVKMSS